MSDSDISKGKIAVAQGMRQTEGQRDGQGEDRKDGYTAVTGGQDYSDRSVWDRAVQPAFAEAVPPAPVPVRRREDTEHTRRMKGNFRFFGPVTFLYAVFYAFCMFRNGSGVTFPFFVAGSLLFLCFSLSKLEISLRKGSVFYMIGMMLLAVSTFCTDDERIIFFNKAGIFLLMMSLLLKQFYDTSRWKLGKYLLAVCQLVFGSLGELGRPLEDAAAYRKERGNGKDRRIWYAALGLVIALPLTFIVLWLLASADAVFREMAGRLLRNFSLGGVCNVILRITFIYFFSYILTACLCKHSVKEEVRDRRTGEPVLAVTVTGMLSALYLLFSGVQIIYLFLGKMELPEGYTYAEYAREGFFQLLAVSILNLVIVLFVMSFFRESRLLKAVLTVMSLCTFVMIASSALRMIMYIRYYYLTFLRILVLWSLAVLALLFLGVIVSIFRDSFPLFRYSVGVVTVLYLVLSFGHPDYIIARVNVANAVRPGEIGWEHTRNDFFLSCDPFEDYGYLSGLSADAAPVLIPFLAEQGYDLSVFYHEDLWEAMGGRKGYYGRVSMFGYYYLEQIQEATERFSLRTFNVSRYMALQSIKRRSPETVSGKCLQGINIHNDTDALFDQAAYTVRLDNSYLTGETLEAEDIDVYFARTGDRGCRIELFDWRINQAEEALLTVELELTIIAEGEYHKVSVKLEPEENGRFAGDYVLREDTGGDYKVEVQE